MPSAHLFFVVGMGLGEFHSRADRVGIFGRGKEDGTVVTEFALVANQVEERRAHTFDPATSAAQFANGKLQDRRSKDSISIQFCAMRTTPFFFVLPCW
jgi:hypothetical protein